MNDKNNRFLGFSLGEEKFGIPLLTVREVIAIPEVTPVPQTPKHFLGIINLRGQVISIIDLRQKLTITPKTGAENAVIIFDINGVSVGGVVDTVTQVYSPKEEDLTEKMELEKTKAAAFISHVYRHNEELILFLDVSKILDVQDQNHIKKAS